MTQTALHFEGKQLRDIGIDRALMSAESCHENWTDIAYDFLLSYIKEHNKFMIEEVREASIGIVPTPPSNRAWGGVVVRAVKEKLIVRKGFRTVKNPKAHCTPASLWQKCHAS